MAPGSESRGTVEGAGRVETPAFADTPSCVEICEGDPFVCEPTIMPFKSDAGFCGIASSYTTRSLAAWTACNATCCSEVHSFAYVC